MFAAPRDAVRRWRRRPVLALTATLVLALGVGATTAMFSVVQAVLLREEPWPDANQLIRVYGVQPEQRTNPAQAMRWNRGGISWQSWRDLQKVPAFTDVAVWLPGYHVVGTERVELARSFYASSTLPALLGARPALGRFFLADEDDKDSGAVIISHVLWVRLFGGDPGVIGALLTASPPGDAGTSASWRRTVVGVLPESLSFPGDAPDVLFPIGFHKYNGSFGNPILMALGRLAPNTTPGAALTAAEPLVRRENSPTVRTARVVTLRDERIGIGDRPLWLMFGGAALLLVVACSNVAGLLLGDARTRRHETAVRLSLGGTRAAIVRGLAIEYVLLALAAGAAGVLLAWWSIPILASLAPPGMLAGRTAALDRTLAAGAIAAAGASTLLAGLTPSLAISTTRPGDALKAGARESTGGGRWWHRLIVAAQFGLTLILLVAAGLFGETLLRLGRQPLGFLPDGVAVLTLERARQVRQPLGPEERARFMELARTNPSARSAMMEAPDLAAFDATIARLAARPDVAAVAAASALPFVGDAPSSMRLRTEGTAADEAVPVMALTVTDGYFRVMGIAMERGRAFRDTDRLSAPPSIIISASLDRRMFGGAGLGRTVLRDGYAFRVIGVVADVKYQTLTDEDAGTVYVPLQSARSARHIVVRASGDVAAQLQSLRTALEPPGSSVFVTRAAALSDIVATTMVIERGRAVLSALYGGIALVLAAVGLYGLAARLVAERRREIGIRIALGAGPRNIRRLVMADAWMIVGAGLLVGVPSAVGASRLAESLFYGVAPTAPHILAMAASTLAVAALVATVVPVWRANRIDPAVTLRED